MKKIILFSLFILIVLTSCNNFFGKSSSKVTITTSLNRSVASVDTPITIKSARIEVSGHDMETIIQTTNDNYFEIEVVNGQSRQFVLEATLCNGIVLKGESLADINPDMNNSILIAFSKLDKTNLDYDKMNSAVSADLGLAKNLESLLAKNNTEFILSPSAISEVHYCVWINGGNEIEVEGVDSFNLIDYIPEPGEHQITLRVYYYNRIEEEKVSITVVDPNSLDPVEIDPGTVTPVAPSLPVKQVTGIIDAGITSYTLGDTIDIIAFPNTGYTTTEWLLDGVSVAKDTLSVDLTTKTSTVGNYKVIFRATYSDRIEEESLTFSVTAPVVSHGLIHNSKIFESTPTALGLDSGTIETIDIDINDSETILGVAYRGEVSGVVKYFIDIYDISNKGAAPVHNRLFSINSETHRRIAKIMIKDFTSGFADFSGDKTFMYVIAETGMSETELLYYDLTNINVVAISQQTSDMTNNSNSLISDVPSDILFDSSNGIFLVTDNGLHLFDPSATYGARYTMKYGNRGGLSGVVIGNSVYTASLNNISFVDDTMGSSSVVINNTLKTDATDMVATGQYIFIVGTNNISNNGTCGLTIIDTYLIDKANTNNPVQKEVELYYDSNISVSISRGNNSYKGIELIGNYAVIADYRGGLRVFNITDPLSTYEEISEAFSVTGGTNDLVVRGDRLYVSSISDGKVYVVPHYFNSF